MGKVCQCGSEMQFRTGMSSKGNKYAMYRCPMCGQIEWASPGDQSQIPQQPAMQQPQQKHENFFKPKTAEDTLLNTCLLISSNLYAEMIKKMDTPDPHEMATDIVAAMTNNLYTNAKEIKSGLYRPVEG